MYISGVRNERKSTEITVTSFAIIKARATIRKAGLNKAESYRNVLYLLCQKLGGNFQINELQ